MMKTSLSCLAFCSLFTACASSPPPPPAAPMLAADNGQPKMQAAQQALEQARMEAQAASPNKGGHRERAMHLIERAMNEVQAGIDFAYQHGGGSY